MTPHHWADETDGETITEARKRAQEAARWDHLTSAVDQFSQAIRTMITGAKKGLGIKP